MPTNGDGQGQVPTASSPDSNGQVPPASQASTQTADNSDNGASSESSSLSLEQLQDALKKARSDAAKSRVDSKRLAELEAYRQQAEDAKLSADEKRDRALAEAQQRAADAETRAQGIAVRAEVKSVARELGIKPELAVKLIDYAEITFNEDGDPTNVAELLQAAAVNLLGLPANGQANQGQSSRVTSGGAVNPGRSNTSNNGLFDGDAQTVMARFSKMSPTEYAAHANEYMQWLNANYRKVSGR